jgi:hypothetical protein
MEGSEITQDVCGCAQRRVLLSRESSDGATLTSGVLHILLADELAGLQIGDFHVNRMCMAHPAPQS